MKIEIIKESEIPGTQAERFVKRYEGPDLIAVKKLIEEGKPRPGKAIKVEISITETPGRGPEWTKAMSFALKIKAFAKKKGFSVDTTWRKVGDSPERYNVYVYRTERK